jgi:hypothetical protein
MATTFEDVLTAQDKAELRDILLETFRTEAAFDQFLLDAMDVNPEANRRDTYETTLTNQIREFAASYRLREFVRKAYGMRRENLRLRTFVESKLPNEGLVEIIERAGLDWPALKACLPDTAPQNLKTDPRVGTSADASLFAQRLGELVDWFAGQPANETIVLGRPIMQFAARLLGSTTSEETADCLRTWIRTTADRDSVSIPDMVLVHDEVDEPIAALIESAVRQVTQAVVRRRRPNTETGWRFVTETAGSHIGRTVAVISDQTSSRWFSSDQTGGPVTSGMIPSIRIVVYRAAVPVTIPRDVVLSWPDASTDRQRLAIVDQLIVHPAHGWQHTPTNQARAAAVWKPSMILMKVNPRVLTPYAIYAVALVVASALALGIPGLWQRLPFLMNHMEGNALSRATPILWKTLACTLVGIVLLGTIVSGLLNMQIMFSAAKMFFLLAFFTFLCAVVTLISGESMIPHLVLALLLVVAFAKHFVLGSLGYYWKRRSFGDTTAEAILLIAFVVLMTGPLRTAF